LDDIYTKVISKRIAASNYINLVLGRQLAVADRMPTHPHHILRECYDGVLLCYLINEVSLVILHSIDGQHNIIFWGKKRYFLARLTSV